MVKYEHALPTWVRPGAAIQYKATDGKWYVATVAWFGEHYVVIQTSHGAHYDIAPQTFKDDTHIRYDAKAHEGLRKLFPALTSSLIGLT